MLTNNTYLTDGAGADAVVAVTTGVGRRRLCLVSVCSRV